MLLGRRYTECVSIRAAIWTVGIVFGLALLGAIGLFTFERTVPLRALAGTHALDQNNELYQQVLKHYSVMLTISDDGSFDMDHPLGSVKGQARVEDRMLTLDIASVDEKSITAWQEDWASRQLDLVRRAKWATPTGPVHGLWRDLQQAKNAEEAVVRLQQNHPYVVGNPFARPWRYELQSARRWRPVDPWLPEKL